MKMGGILDDLETETNDIESVVRKVFYIGEIFSSV